MKTSTSSVRQRGSVLVTTLVIALLVGLVVAALLFVAQQQNYLTARSRVWCSEIPLAEAGAEEAVTHIVSMPASLTDNNWTWSGSNYYKIRTFTNGTSIDGYLYATIISNSPMTNTVISVGFSRIPLQTNYSQRSVKTIVKKTQNDWGFVAKRDIVFNGNSYADSYISTDPLWSTNGMYDPAKRRDHCGVASISSLTPAIDAGKCGIFGSAATGPGGTVSGDVGDGTWLASNNGPQPGHVTDDFNMAITDVPWPPSPAWPVLPLPPNNQTNTDGVVYERILPAGDYQFGASSPGGNGWLIKGKVRVYINGSLKMSSSAGITIATNSTLELYLGGDMDMSGKAIVNPSGLTANCMIYGLTNCTSIKYAGSAEAYARIYAPYAYVEISGGFDFFGSVVSDRMKFSGTSALHYDEALDPAVPQYRVVAWEEL